MCLLRCSTRHSCSALCIVCDCHEPLTISTANSSQYYRIHSDLFRPRYISVNHWRTVRTDCTHSQPLGEFAQYFSQSICCPRILLSQFRCMLISDMASLLMTSSKYHQPFCDSICSYWRGSTISILGGDASTPGRLFICRKFTSAMGFYGSSLQPSHRHRPRISHNRNPRKKLSGD